MSITYRGSFNLRVLENDDFNPLNEIIEATPGGGAGYYKAIFGPYSLPSLKDFSVLSLVAEERAINATEKSSIKGFLCVNDAISSMGESQNFQKVIELLSNFIHVTVNNALFISFYMMDEATKASHLLLQETFAQLPHIDYIIWITPFNFITSPDIEGLFDSVFLGDMKDEAIVNQLKTTFKGMKVFYCHRSRILPRLSVRRARVEDNDDLIPIIQRTHPDILQHSDHYILADLILKQDQQNAFYVGLEYDEIKGMLSTSLDVNMSLIMKIFDIDAYPDLIIQSDAIPPPPPLFIALVGDIRLLDTSALENTLLEQHCLFVNYQMIEDQYMTYLQNNNNSNNNKTDGPEASYAEELTLSNPMIAYLYYHYLVAAGHHHQMGPEDIQAIVLWGYPPQHEDERAVDHAHMTITYEFDYILELQEDSEDQDDDEDEFLQGHLDALDGLKDWYFRDDLPSFAIPNNTTTTVKHYPKGKAVWKKLSCTRDVMLTENVSKLIHSLEECIIDRGSRVEAAKIMNKEKPPKANALAITALCMEDIFASRSIDLIKLAFEDNASVDYCLYMISNNHEETISTQTIQGFNYIKPRPGVSFDQSLYLIHRVYFKTRDNLNIQRIDHQLLETSIYSYLQKLPSQAEQSEVLHQLQYSLHENDIAVHEHPQDIAFAIQLGPRKVIGLVILSKRMLSREDIAWFRTYYHVENYVNYELHRMSSQYMVLHWSIDPIFTSWIHFLLQKILRLCQKTVLYYHLDSQSNKNSNNAVVPPKEILETFVFIPPQRIPQGMYIPYKTRPILYDLHEPDKIITVPNHQNPLFLFMKGQLYHYKEIVTKRMVIIGGSNHSYSFLETFCSIPTIYYPNLYFIADLLPSPLLTNSNNSNSYEGNEIALGITSGLDEKNSHYCGCLSLQDVDFPLPEELAAMGYSFRVNIIRGRLSDIDRDHHAVIISDEMVLEYDYLLLSTSTQDNSYRTVPSLAAVHPAKCADAGIFMLGNPTADLLALSFIRKRAMNRSEPVVISGTVMKVLTAAESLLQVGMDPNKIVLVIQESEESLENTATTTTTNASNGANGGAPGGGELILSNLLIQAPSIAGIKSIYWKSTIAEISLSRNGFLQTVELKEVSPPLLPSEGKSGKVNNSNQSVSMATTATTANESKDKDSLMNAGPIRLNCIALCFCGLQEQQSCERDIFAAINDCGLVFDGGLIVNMDFQTVDPQIYAVSDYSKFSRIYSNEMPHFQYNARELGSYVAINLISKHFLPFSYASYSPSKLLTHNNPLFSAPSKSIYEESKNSNNSNQEEKQQHSSSILSSSSSAKSSMKKKKLQFVLPRSVRANFPAGFVYFHSTLPKYAFTATATTASIELQSCLTDNVHVQSTMVSPPPRRVVSLKMDALGIVAQITYLGLDTTIECRNLALLPGKHETTLNNCVYTHRKGLVDDWIDFFRSKWCAIIYLNHFPLFCAALKRNISHDKGVILLLNRIFERAEYIMDFGEMNEYRRSLIGGNGELLIDTTRQIIEQETIEYVQKHREFMPQFYIK